MRQVSFEAIGTVWNLQVLNVLDDKAWTTLLEQIQARITVFDRTYSRFRSDSLVSRMATRAGKYELPLDGYALLHFYEQLYKATDGKVTPLIGQTMTAAGYDATYSFQPGKLVAPPRWEDILSYNEQHLTLTQPTLLDFGAAGKGYLVDIVGELLQTAGLQDFLINAGGDIVHRSSSGQQVTVGLENPYDTTEVIGTVQLSSQSLCASSGSKRQWQGYHHIIDPQTLVSPDDIMATWVIAEDTMTADGLATALFFVEPAKLRQEFTFSYAVLQSDMQVHHSSDFPAELFIEGRHAVHR